MERKTVVAKRKHASQDLCNIDSNQERPIVTAVKVKKAKKSKSASDPTLPPPLISIFDDPDLFNKMPVQGFHMMEGLFSLTEDEKESLKCEDSINTCNTAVVAKYKARHKFDLIVKIKECEQVEKTRRYLSDIYDSLPNNENPSMPTNATKLRTCALVLKKLESEWDSTLPLEFKRQHAFVIAKFKEICKFLWSASTYDDERMHECAMLAARHIAKFNAELKNVARELWKPKVEAWSEAPDLRIIEEINVLFSPRVLRKLE